MTPISADEAERRALFEVGRVYPRLALALYHHKTTRNTIWSQKDRYWQLALYKDDADRIVVQKASQCGITDWMLCEMFAKAKSGLPGMYVLPTNNIVYEFTPRRIDRLIERVPYYRANCRQGRKDSDSKTQKTIFGQDWNIVGSNVATNFYEKPLDVLLIDEYDKCDQDNLSFTPDRLASAKREVRRYIGNPTVGGFGIADEFEQTDQKHWYLKCDKCGTEQVPDWWKNFVVQDSPNAWRLRDPQGRMVCLQCAAPMNRLGRGKWIAHNPGRKRSGYHVSRLFGDVRPDAIEKLFEEFIAALNNLTKLQRFYNNILGITFQASGAKITDDLLQSCAEQEFVSATDPLRCAGVDINIGLHYVVFDSGERKRLVEAGIAVDYVDLAEKMNRMGVRLGVMDAGPEIHAPREFVRQNRGWYLCRYNLSEKLIAQKSTSHQDMHVDYEERTVSVNRTESLDRQLSEFQNGLISLPADYGLIDGGAFVKMMKIPTRTKQERPDGTSRYIWTKGEDHYFHACNYALIATRIHRTPRITVL